MISKYREETDTQSNGVVGWRWTMTAVAHGSD
jgi:hypothetical protein